MFVFGNSLTDSGNAFLATSKLAPLVPVIPAPNNHFYSCGYVALYGKALGLNNQYLLKPNGYWLSGDGKRRTALMADKFYWSSSQNLIEINHYERRSVDLWQRICGWNQHAEVHGNHVDRLECRLENFG